MNPNEKTGEESASAARAGRVAALARSKSWAQAIEEARSGSLLDLPRGPRMETAMGAALFGGADGLPLAQELASRGVRAAASKTARERETAAHSGGLAGSLSEAQEHTPRYPLSMAICGGHAPSVALALELGGFEGLSGLRPGEPWWTLIAYPSQFGALGEEAVASIWRARPLVWLDCLADKNSMKLRALPALIGVSIMHVWDAEKRERRLGMWESLRLPSMEALSVEAASACARSMAMVGGGAHGMLALRERWGAQRSAPEHGQQLLGSICAMAIKQGLGMSEGWAAAAVEAPEIEPAVAQLLWNNWAREAAMNPMANRPGGDTQWEQMGRFAAELKARADLGPSPEERIAKPTGDLRTALQRELARREAASLAEAANTANATRSGDARAETGAGAGDSRPGRAAHRL
jgi:hypothetical protein